MSVYEDYFEKYRNAVKLHNDLDVEIERLVEDTKTRIGELRKSQITAARDLARMRQIITRSIEEGIDPVMITLSNDDDEQTTTQGSFWQDSTHLASTGNLRTTGLMLGNKFVNSVVLDNQHYGPTAPISGALGSLQPMLLNSVLNIGVAGSNGPPQALGSHRGSNSNTGGHHHHGGDMIGNPYP